MSFIVCKFGGSSVADSAMFQQVARILKKDPSRRYIVLSAPGKRDSRDKKITDLLYRCHAVRHNPTDFEAEYSRVRERFLEIARAFSLESHMEQWLAESQPLLLSDADSAASRGEYLCARLFAEFASLPFVDAKELICFDEGGQLDEEASYSAIRKALSNLPFAVIPGFYGAMPDGRLRTLKRGGSDVTGALVARAMGADLYENWTDVDGVLTADPKLFPDAVPVTRISYAQMGLLSRLGASVLHPDSIKPLFDACIPTRVRNTRRPLAPGTLITTESGVSAPCVSGTTGLSMLRAYAPAEACLNKLMGKVPLEGIFSAYDRTDLIVRTSELSVMQHALTGIICTPPRGVAVIAAVWNGRPRLADTLCRLLSGLISGIQHTQSGCLLLLTGEETYLEVLTRLRNEIRGMPSPSDAAFPHAFPYETPENIPSMPTPMKIIG